MSQSTLTTIADARAGDRRHPVLARRREQGPRDDRRTSHRLAAGGTADGQPLGQAPEPTYRSNYLEFAPPRHLREHVLCFWHHSPTSLPSAARVIPDGCVDVVWVNDRPPFIAGPATRPVVYRLEAGTEIVGVRLRPGVAHRLLGIGADQLRNRDVPLRSVWPHDRCRPWAEAADKETLAAKLRSIQEAVTSRLATTDGDDAFVAWAATWLAKHPFGRIDEIGRLSGLGERQIRRRFERAVGYGPKQLQRIMRLQFLLWLAGQAKGPRPTLVGLSLDAGYADQSHMTREVVALTGASPSQLLFAPTVASTVSDLFKTSPDPDVRMALRE